MKKKMMPHIKAGRITQLYGFGLLVILMVTLYLNVIPNWKLQSRSVFLREPVTSKVLLLLAYLGLPTLIIILGRAIKKHRIWARYIGIGSYLLMLISYLRTLRGTKAFGIADIGTIIGGIISLYVLWCLMIGWEDNPKIEQDAGVVL